MLLTKLLRGTALEDQAAVSDREITGLTCDSRTVTPGALFAAFRGSRTDGNRFIREALDKGATAVLCQTPPAGQDGPWLVTDDPRAVFGQMTAHWFGDPGRRMTLIGVTGTNGKTTTTYLLKTILEQTLGAKVGLIGTNQNLVGHEVLPARRTTPDAYTLQALLAKMEGAGCSHVVMEVSSHALAQGRTAGLRFRTGIFTNLTRDHLDFHGSMTAYRQAKSLLFRQCDSGCFNLDDNSGRLLIRGADCRVVTFGVNQRRAEIRARGIRLEPDRVRFLVDTPQETLPVTVPIPGRFTVYNALGALACCYDLGIPLAKAIQALEKVPPVKGRLEVVPVPAPYTVVIDYAHTPDALEQVLADARRVTQGRLLCLFGCGGDRDKTKRPVMGEIAASLSDLVILTSDNPRTEDPEAILDQVAAGFPRGFADYHREPDRRAAIALALSLGRAGDVILLAGKGHETYQEIGKNRLPLDEREEIASFFQKSKV